MVIDYLLILSSLLAVTGMAMLAFGYRASLFSTDLATRFFAWSMVLLAVSVFGRRVMWDILSPVVTGTVDGQPFTADDIVFWWDRVENNIKITTGGPRGELKNNGAVPVVTKVDDYTVTFAYEEPNGLFLQNMAGPYGQRAVQFPRSPAAVKCRH